MLFDTARAKKLLRVLYISSYQILFLMKLSRWFYGLTAVGKLISIYIDLFILFLYGLEVSSHSLKVRKLIIGHSTGVVLGGNGINCSGMLHVSSGVVFARRYKTDKSAYEESFFQIDGDLTVGANSVILGPVKIKGPVIIGAMSLVSHDIDVPGIYVGCPAKLIKRL